MAVDDPTSTGYVRQRQGSGEPFSDFPFTA